VSFTPLTKIALTKAGANPLAVNVDYNPTSYTLPTDYAPLFTLVGTSPLVQRMLVYPGGADKIADGTTTAVFTSFKPDINGLIPGAGALTLVAGIGNSAEYNTPDPGVNKPITYSGYTLGGATAGFALPTPCCGVVTRTTGTIAPRPIPPVPPGIPPVLPVVPDIPIEAIAAPGFVMGDQMFPATGPAWLPTVVDTRTPPQLLSIAPPPPVVVPPPRVEEAPPPIYVPPVRPPKQDRN
jgi:hypothetical protein